MSRTSRVLIVAYNPYLSGLYRLATALGILKGPLPTTFVTERISTIWLASPAVKWFARLRELLPEAGPESLTLPRPRSERARKLADYLTAHPEDGRALETVTAEVSGASSGRERRAVTPPKAGN